MKTKTINVFSYDELSEDAKEKALEKFYDLNVSFDWWEYLYEDAERIGLKITEFDLGRGHYARGKLLKSVGEVCAAILAEHGKTCETFKLAEEYYRRKRENRPFDEEEFRDLLLEEYVTLLDREYEYQTSREAIEEGIRANEYEFTEDGKLFRGGN